MRLVGSAALAGLAVVRPRAVLAHSTVPGLDDFSAGLLHPLLVPEHLLLLAGIGLWLGGRDRGHVGRALPAFAGALLIGLALSGFAPVGTVERWMLLGLALAGGGLVAAALSLPRWLAALLAAAAALGIGLDSPSYAAGLRGDLLILAGTWTAAHLILLNLIAIASFCRSGWRAIALRVAGSWTAAGALLVLALDLGARWR